MPTTRMKHAYCHSRDGVRIAYSAMGSGPPLVIVTGWLSHLELDLECPLRRHLYRELSRDHTLIRFDSRGFGLSQRDIGDHGLDLLSADLAAVVDDLELSRFALLSLAWGAPVAVDYAASHPGRVSHLIVHGGFVRGALRRDLAPGEEEVAGMLARQVERGWLTADNPIPVVPLIFASSYSPYATPRDHARFCEIALASMTGKDGARRLRALYQTDTARQAARISSPTLVLHGERELNPPFEEGRLLASLIPHSRFVSLDATGNFPSERDPTWLEELRAFVHGTGDAAGEFASLSPRELEVTKLVALGHANAQIARRLMISEGTVRNHVSRVFSKLRLGTRVQLIVLAKRAGLTSVIE
jgi:pimeloyl-ACP methyl ester carboxylesterase/DNA-binding CsgD family transcriptional regulator